MCGIAGLAAAKNLADAGLSAVVLEKRDVNGGKLSSWRSMPSSVWLTPRRLNLTAGTTHQP